MTTVQYIGLCLLTGLFFVLFQVALEIIRGKILIRRQEEVAKKMYELGAYYVVKIIKEIKEKRQHA